MGSVNGASDTASDVKGSVTTNHVRRLPQYHLPELPRLNKCKNGFNWAGGAGQAAKVKRK